MRATRLALLVVPVLLTSCALATRTDRDPASSEAPVDGVAAAEADPTAEREGVGSEPSAEPASASSPTVPTGTFPSIEALCAAQEVLIAPRLLEAEKELAERYEPEVREKLTARCEVSKTALATTAISLRAPFLEVAAIEIEAGRATETHVVARTAAGWTALPQASMDSWHDDPGCFSIERAAGIVEIRVEGDATRTLVVVESTDRGQRWEEPEEPSAEGAISQISWSDVTKKARACRVGSAGFACDDPIVVEVENVPSTHEGGRQSVLRFTTTITVDAAGRLVPAETYAGEP